MKSLFSPLHILKVMGQKYNMSRPTISPVCYLEEGYEYGKDVVGYKSYCRDCWHGVFVHDAKKQCHIIFDWKNGLKELCHCEGYIPQDNLEYLEFRYDKKVENNVAGR